jgi:hypothetical protein
MKERLNAIIIAAAILLAVVIYCFWTRYQVLRATRLPDSGLVTVEYDRMTGEAWCLVYFEEEKLPVKIKYSFEMSAKDIVERIREKKKEDKKAP